MQPPSLATVLTLACMALPTRQQTDGRLRSAGLVGLPTWKGTTMGGMASCPPVWASTVDSSCSLQITTHKHAQRERVRQDELINPCVWCSRAPALGVAAGCDQTNRKPRMRIGRALFHPSQQCSASSSESHVRVDWAV